MPIQFNDISQYKPGDILISETAIKKRLQILAAQMAKDYAKKNLLIITVMKGSFMVLADLIRELHTAGLEDFSVSAVTVGSYSGTQSNRKPRFKHEIDIDAANRHILLVEDIVDTGHTLQFVMKELSKRNPASIECFSLLSKPSRREVTIDAKYVGFVIPNVWIQGYGLDTDEYGRGNPNIIVGPVKPSHA